MGAEAMVRKDDEESAEEPKRPHPGGPPLAVADPRHPHWSRDERATP